MVKAPMQKTPEQKRMHTIRQLWALLYANSAFESAKDIAEHYLSVGCNNKHKLHEALAAATATLYAQPFIEVSKHDTMPTLPKLFHQFDDAEQAKTHKLLIDARNNYYAHSNPQRPRDVVLWLRRKENGIIQMTTIANQQGLHGDVFRNIPGLCELQISRFEKQKWKLLSQLYTADGLLKQVEASRRKSLKIKLPWPKA
jgi:hypothetical protein